MLNDVVNRLTIEFSCNSEQTAKVVSHEIKHYWMSRFTQILSRVMSENTNNSMLRKIDRLEIDLGDIHLEDIGSKDVYVRFAKLLTEKIEATAERSSGSVFPLAHVHLQVLKTLLLSGDLPWWINKNDFGNLDNTMQSAMDEDIEEFKHFLISHRDNPGIIRRIRMFCSPGMVSVLTRLIPELHNKNAVSVTDIQRKLHWDKLPDSKINGIVSALNSPEKNYDLKYLIIQNLLESHVTTLLEGITHLRLFSEESLIELRDGLNSGNPYLKPEKWLQQLNVYQLEFLRHPELWKGVSANNQRMSSFQAGIEKLSKP